MTSLKSVYNTSLNCFWQQQAQSQQKDLDLIQKHVKASLRQQNFNLPHQKTSNNSNIYELAQQQEQDKNDILSKILPAISLAQTLSPWVLTSPYLQFLGYEKISIKLERSSHLGKSKTVKQVTFIKPPSIKNNLEISNPLFIRQAQEQKKNKTSEETSKHNQNLKLENRNNQYKSTFQPIINEINKNHFNQIISKSSKSKKSKNLKTLKEKRPNQKLIQTNKNIQDQKQPPTNTNFLKSQQFNEPIEQEFAHKQILYAQTQKQFPSEYMIQDDYQKLNQPPKRSFDQMIYRSQALNNNKGSNSQAGLAITRARRNNAGKINYAVDNYLETISKRKNPEKSKNYRKPKVYNPDDIYTDQFKNSLQSLSNHTTNDKANHSIKPCPLKQTLLKSQRGNKQYSTFSSVEQLKQKSHETEQNDKSTSEANLKKPRGRPFGWRKSKNHIQLSKKQDAEVSSQIFQREQKEKINSNQQRSNRSFEMRSHLRKDQKNIPLHSNLRKQENETKQKQILHINHQSEKEKKGHEILGDCQKVKKNSLQKKLDNNKINNMNKSLRYPSQKYNQTTQEMFAKKAKQGNKGIRLQDSDDSQSGQNILRSVVQNLNK